MAIGSNASYLTTGGGNVAIGINSLETNTSGTNNTVLGTQADVASGGLSNATAIGAQAIVGESNALVLGNNANVGIGTSTPSAKLDLVGNVRINDGTAQPGYVLTASDISGTASWQPAAGGQGSQGPTGPTGAQGTPGTKWGDRRYGLIRC